MWHPNDITAKYNEYLWVLTFPLLDCSEFGNFVITLIEEWITRIVILVVALVFLTLLDYHFKAMCRNAGCWYCRMFPLIENRNDPDLVQAFLKKWWVESDFKAPSLPLSLRLKVSGCHYNISCNIKISCKSIYKDDIIIIIFSCNIIWVPHVEQEHLDSPLIPGVQRDSCCYPLFNKGNNKITELRTI
jgi:hypothetical protein